MTDTPQIILYHYTFSPYARRIQWYLLLRGLPYSECMQPPVMPRPDLERLGVRHRRIPVLAIGRDVYVDTRLMLRKLEQIPATAASGIEFILKALSPTTRNPNFGGQIKQKSSKTNQKERILGSAELLLLEHLFETLTTDAGLFSYCASLIPPNLPVMRDPVFLRDRASFRSGKPLPAVPAAPPSSSSTQTTKPPPRRRTGVSLARAEALVEVRHAAALLESTLLADGRSWLLGTPAPSLADIEAVWPFHWLSTMPGALCADFGDDGSAPAGRLEGLSPAQFPRLFAWIGRFDAAVRAARKAASGPQVARQLDGAQAAAAVQAAPFFEQKQKEEEVQADDPVAQVTGLRVGQPVVVWPVDSGSSHKDVGALVRLSDEEVVLAVAPPPAAGQQAPVVHLHAPRHGFRVRPYSADTATGARL